VEVHFYQKIRDEIRFQSLEELKAQIVKDVAKTKKIFAEIKRL
jgi:riboflavin kinase/FMN adenylyltransferase